jgi:NADH-quinone oxidoreductase subunit M
VAFLVIMLSSIGLPGLNGFVGEFLILLGAFGVSHPAAAIGTLGIILGAVYMLWMFQRVMFGPLDNDDNRHLTDLSTREIVVLAPLIAMIVFMGVYPQPFLRRMEPAVEAFVARVQTKTAVAGVGSRVTGVGEEELASDARHPRAEPRLQLASGRHLTPDTRDPFLSSGRHPAPDTRHLP